MSVYLCPICQRTDHATARRCPTFLPLTAAAHALLDRAAAGEPVDAADIDAALRVTGDLAPVRRSWVDLTTEGAPA